MFKDFFSLEKTEEGVGEGGWTMIASRVEGDEHRGKGLIIGAILAIIMLPCILNVVEVIKQKNDLIWFTFLKYHWASM